MGPCLENGENLDALLGQQCREVSFIFSEFDFYKPYALPLRFANMTIVFPSQLWAVDLIELLIIRSSRKARNAMSGIHNGQMLPIEGSGREPAGFCESLSRIVILIRMVLPMDRSDEVCDSSAVLEWGCVLDS